ncbi:branched-chain amino acid ABC transporter substrate-binding protein [Labrenzia sp. PHM005]|uniref:branched-chain amino acid ABC transporter substrate-binding protein n=1 Tax=Labrenzia sp. PHM005 TaxID=2590016 RepID=UPI001140633A|nr:branched-chain amino acid ABC transporter substrate-binding protein [Labrenzia sp. PHM005]QDG78302.1 branched-chain amino acid ABC transporter substrate-binding protein [Labrenzia sp. PHM005]
MQYLKTLVAATALAVCSAGVSSAETLKIGYIDPLSGPFALTGDTGLKHFRYAADKINDTGGAAGMTVEIVPFDNKINPKESLVQLQKAIDQGIRYIVQGNGSSVASALIDAINKHNKRNPGDEVLFLNYAAVDPAFTNDRCSFWHFRFDADADMKMEAMTDWLAEQQDIKKVYILGQDYSFGKAVAGAAVKMISEKRPDIEIVGNELHPLGKVKDFTPYIQKMISAEADAVITGNWGQDMTLLVKAASASGHKVPYLTYYGGGLGAVATMGESAIGLVKQITEFHQNIETSEDQIANMDRFQERYGTDYYYQRVFTLMEMFDRALDDVGENDPVKVAFALEGMGHETPYGSVSMRKDNHQLIQPMFISTFSDDITRKLEGTDFGFKTDPDGVIKGEATRTETTCQMKRPS